MSASKISTVVEISFRSVLSLFAACVCCFPSHASWTHKIEGSRTEIYPTKTEAPLSEVERLWILTISDKYTAHKSDLPRFPGHRDVDRTNDRVDWLQRTLPKMSVAATAVAYWGALNLDHPEKWVDRMVGTRRILGRNDKSAVLDLPDALSQVFVQRKCDYCIRALISMKLDGGYQESLDSVRYPLFLQYPEIFARCLKRLPSQCLVRTAQQLGPLDFTYMLSARLDTDKEQREAYSQLYASCKERHDTDSQFLVRYLGYVLRLTEEAPWRNRKRIR